MLYLSPEFRNYGPPPLMVGGVGITPPYRSSDLTNEMPRVLKDIGDSVRQAYGIYDN